MSQQRTKLIDTTLQRIETNLVRRRASQKAAQLYRVTTGEGCYFAARADMDREDFDCIAELEPGTGVRIRAAWAPPHRLDQELATEHPAL